MMNTDVSPTPNHRSTMESTPLILRRTFQSATLSRLSLCVAIGLMCALLAGCERPPAGTAVDVAPARAIGTVDLEVDFGGLAPKIAVAIPCSRDSTALTALTRAHQNGDLDLSASGSGETAFVRSINKIAGNSAQDMYWFFLINDQLAQRGAGVTEINPGDHVEWVYQKTPDELKP